MADIGVYTMTDRGPCPHCHLPFSKCGTCDARILWATTPKGKPMPVDVELTTIAVVGGVQNRLHGKPSRVWEQAKGHVPHHITCKNWPPRVESEVERAAGSAV